VSKPVEIPEAYRFPLAVEQRIVKDLHTFHGDFASSGCGICMRLRREIAKAILLKAADVFDQCGWWKMAEENRKQAAALGEEGE
jgi:hypothetical protein